MNSVQDSRTRLITKIINRIGKCICLDRIENNKKYEKVNDKLKIFSYKHYGIFNYIYFCYKSYFFSKKYKPIIIISDNRAAIIPALIAKLGNKNSINIHDIRELYTFKSVKSIRGKLGCIIEIIFLKKFDITICANYERVNVTKNIFKLKTVPLVLENISVLNYMNNNENELENKFKNIFNNLKKKIISSDGYSIERRVNHLVKVMKELGEDFILYIAGSNKNNYSTYFINKIIKDYKIKNVIFLGILNESELKYCISRSDVGIVSYNRSDLNNILCASGKFYEFMNERKPVVATENIPLINLCRKYNTGICDDSFINGIKSIFGEYEKYSNNTRSVNCNDIFNVQSELIIKEIFKNIKRKKYDNI